jgi:hypothetical protein
MAVFLVTQRNSLTRRSLQPRAGRVGFEVLLCLRAHVVGRKNVDSAGRNEVNHLSFVKARSSR